MKDGKKEFKIKNIKDLFEFLSKALNVDKEELIDTYRRNKFAPFAPVIVAKDIDRMKAIVIEENKYLYPSLFVQESYKRIYPFDKIGAHVLGYVDKVNRAKIERFKEYGYSFRSTMGYSGVEEYYDSYLKGQEGGFTFRKEPLQRVYRTGKAGIARDHKQCLSALRTGSRLDPSG